MIALDTNVLVRSLMRDHLGQLEAANNLLSGSTRLEPAFICREVIIEFEFVLRRRYDLSRSDIADALIELCGSAELIVECSEDVEQAAFLYSQGGRDFADLMILAAARRATAEKLYTFDRRLSREPGGELIETGE